MILHPFRCAAVRDLPERIASIEVKGGDPGPWWCADGYPLQRRPHAARADHLDIGFSRLGLLHSVHRSFGPCGGSDVQEPGLGIKRATFPVHTARTWECEGAFGAFRLIDDGRR